MAFVPCDHFWEFSLATVRFTHDEARPALVPCAKSLSHTTTEAKTPLRRRLLHTAVLQATDLHNSNRSVRTRCAIFETSLQPPIHQRLGTESIGLHIRDSHARRCRPQHAGRRTRPCPDAGVCPTAASMSMRHRWSSHLCHRRALRAEAAARHQRRRRVDRPTSRHRLDNSGRRNRRASLAGFA